MILRLFDLPSHLIYLNSTRISGNFARKIFEKFAVFVGILQNFWKKGPVKGLGAGISVFLALQPGQLVAAHFQLAGVGELIGGGLEVFYRQIRVVQITRVLYAEH
jgi:hypothetical protein